MKKLLIMTLPLILFAAACNNADKQDAKESDNPFFQSWDTPHETPPFDKIKTGHYMPAFKEAIKREEAEIKEITENK
jgi:peptidyl-dipeptidase Dcp